MGIFFVPDDIYFEITSYEYFLPITSECVISSSLNTINAKLQSKTTFYLKEEEEYLLVEYTRYLMQEIIIKSTIEVKIGQNRRKFGCN